MQEREEEEKDKEEIKPEEMINDESVSIYANDDRSVNTRLSALFIEERIGKEENTDDKALTNAEILEEKGHSKKKHKIEIEFAGQEVHNGGNVCFLKDQSEEHKECGSQSNYREDDKLISEISSDE